MSVIDLFNIGEQQDESTETVEQTTVSSDTEQEETEEVKEEEVDETPEQEQEEEESQEAEEEAEESEPTPLDSLIASLTDNETLLFDPEKDYEEGEAGIIELINETKEKVSKTAVEQYKESIPEKGQALLDILSKGGTVDDFIELDQQVDYSAVPLHDNSGQPIVKYQLNLVEDLYRLQNFSDEIIQSKIKDLQEHGLLEKEAALAKNLLHNHQEETKKQKLESIEQQQIEDQKAAEEAATAFKEQVVNAREIKGFKISKEKASQLYDYVTLRDKSGKTAFEKDDNAETRLLYALMAMNKFDKNALSKEIATKQTISIKKKINRFKDQTASTKSRKENKSNHGASSESSLWWTK